jgi:hypothetical protein
VIAELRGKLVRTQPVVQLRDGDGRPLLSVLHRAHLVGRGQRQLVSPNPQVAPENASFRARAHEKPLRKIRSHFHAWALMIISTQDM